MDIMATTMHWMRTKMEKENLYELILIKLDFLSLNLFLYT